MKDSFPFALFKQVVVGNIHRSRCRSHGADLCWEEISTRWKSVFSTRTFFRAINVFSHSAQ